MGTHRRRSSGSVLMLTAVSAVVPGTAHLAAGRRRVGVALVAVGVILVGVLGFVGLRTSKSDFLHVVVRPGALNMITIAAAVLAVVWITLVLRSYLVLQPPGPRTGERVVGATVVALLCVAVAAPPLVVARYAYVQRGLINSVFPDSEVTVVHEGGRPVAANDPWKGRQRLNMLLIASDAGDDRTGTRTDSMVVLSTDVHSGDVAMFSLPRNLERVPMPAGPLQQAWPDRFPDLLNAVYQRVTERPQLLAGARDRGAEALKRVVGNVLGIRVDYYVMINLQGFQTFVDALGGVTLDVPRRLPIGGILGNGQHVKPSGYIEAGRNRHLNGFEALWFSRSRSDSSDYERMGRQRCLIGAVAKQVSPASMLTHFQKLASATKQLVATDLPQGILQPMVDLADKIRSRTDIRSVQFVPPLINTGDPDFDLIRTKVRQALAKPAAKPPTHAGAPTTTPPPRAGGNPATTTKKPGAGTTTQTTNAADIQSVDEACALH